MLEISQQQENSIGNIPQLYVDHQEISFGKKFLSEESYQEAIQGMVVVCTDIVLVNKKECAIYLAKRKAKPANDKWWVMGGRVFAGEEAIHSVQRCLKRESGIEIKDLRRFEYVCMNRYFFINREQDPQDIPVDSLTYTYLLELDVAEMEKINLDQQEYFGEIKKFTSLQEMQNENIDKPIIDIYLKIFPN